MSEIRWKGAVAGAIGAEISQIVAAVLWVAIYSHLIDPGQPVAVYEKHAQVSGPWVSVIAGFPIFYWFSCRFAGNVPSALALFSVFFVVDGALLLAATEGSPSAVILPVVLSYSTKLLACYLGGVQAQGGR